MKSIGLAALLLAGGICMPANLLAQTIQTSQVPAAPMPPFPAPALGSALTNLPTTTLGAEKIGISTGTLMHGASSFGMGNNVDYNFTTNIFARAEVDVDNSSSVVDALGVGPGVRKAWTSAEIYAALVGRRNWDTAKWEAVLEPGIAYTPASSGSVWQNWSIQLEPRLVINGGGRPSSETFLGARYSF